MSGQLFGHVLQRFNPLKQENDTPAKQMSVIISLQGKGHVIVLVKISVCKKHNAFQGWLRKWTQDYLNFKYGNILDKDVWS